MRGVLVVETERIPDRMTPRCGDWPKRYRCAFAVEMHAIGLRARLAETERWVSLLDDESRRAHVALDRLRFHPERLDRDPDLLDNFEDGLAHAVEAEDEAVAQRDQLRTKLDETERRHELGLPLANGSDGVERS